MVRLNLTNISHLFLSLFSHKSVKHTSIIETNRSKCHNLLRFLKKFVGNIHKYGKVAKQKEEEEIKIVNVFCVVK